MRLPPPPKKFFNALTHVRLHPINTVKPRKKAVNHLFKIENSYFKLFLNVKKILHIMQLLGTQDEFSLTNIYQ